MIYNWEHGKNKAFQGRGFLVLRENSTYLAAVSYFLGSRDLSVFLRYVANEFKQMLSGIPEVTLIL